MNSAGESVDADQQPRCDVLVIEDDCTTRETFLEVLRSAGYRVAGAEGFETDAILRLRPSIILLDLHMPMVDGLQCLRQLRDSAPHAAVPVAVITGDYLVDEGVVEELSALGASVHFKPVWDDDLLRIVKMLLDRAAPPV